MNLETPFICDIETVGLLPDLTKGQEEDFHILGCSYYSGGKWNVKTTSSKEDVFKLFENPNNTIVGHNFYLYDLPALEKIFPSIKIKATIIDTLFLSWYIEPNRNKHGLEKYGEDFGIAKPEVKDSQWKGEGLTKEEHKELMETRVSEDVKINTVLWLNILEKYKKLYKNDMDLIKSHINFISTKAKTYKMFYYNPLRVDYDRAIKNKNILEDNIEDKVNILSEAMPKVPKKAKRTKPKNIYKKDGTFSKAGERWKHITKLNGLDIDYEDTLEEIIRWEDPNPQSIKQVKDWLFSLGWKPIIFNESTLKSGEINKVPQIRDRDKNLCDSVKELIKKEPSIKELENLSTLQHRLGIIKGFLRDSDEDNNITAGIGGLANTLRIKHRTLVNLPSVHADYGEYIRCLLIPQKGYKFMGSDISGLENQTKLNFIYDYDKEYVNTMLGKYYDAHLDIGTTASLVTENESIFYRWFKAHDKDKNVKVEDIVYGEENLPKGFYEYLNSIENKEEEFSRIDVGRQSSKTTNYSATYEVGAKTLSKTLKCSISFAENLLDAYWKKNWSVRSFKDDQTTKTLDGEEWVLNPLNGYWYSLRSEHTKFSTLNQGAGDYIFTLWCYFCMQAGLKLSYGAHDEILMQVKESDIDKYANIINESMNKVNDVLGLRIPIKVDYDVGVNYAEVH